MSRLPNFIQAVIEDSKLLDYALNPENERGRHKARVFQSALGFNLANWQMLRQAILEGLPDYDALLTSETPFGAKYRVTLSITGPNDRKADVLTIWQFDRLPDGTLNSRPRLVTLYIL